MVQYEKPAEQDRIRRITAELDEVKGVMRDNLDKMVQRGDLLESLDTATQALEVLLIHLSLILSRPW